MITPTSEFDAENYRKINAAREVWLQQVVSLLPFRRQLATALDLGCGAGFFSEVLSKLGFKVVAMDLQPENLALCRTRYPHIRFEQIDLDAQSPEESADLMLLFGILYHLQSPLQTILRVAPAARRVVIVETRVAAGNQMACYLFREKEGPAHNLARLTAVPTWPALSAMFDHAGFKYIYRPEQQPIHTEWTEGENGQRHSFIASREPISVAGWPRVAPGRILEKWEKCQPENRAP